MAAIYGFGPFRLDSRLGLLMCGTEPTELGQRAVSLLRLLVECGGQPVSREALIEAAWPGLAVEDGNLTVQIAALRKVLGDGGGAGWIETLPRRGYRYVGPAVQATGASSAPSEFALPEKPSIAVLPFANLSADPEQDYFADGMVDDIIAGLSRVRWLFVIARSSTLRYRAVPIDVRQVGRQLGVRYVLQGSVRKAANQIRISCQLADAATSAQLWAERYDRKQDDVFVLQDEVSLAVVGAIEPSLRRTEAERVRRKRPDSLDAYELVLRSQPDVFSGMPEPSARALSLLGRALALDPDYALANAYAAMCHHNLFLRDGLKGTDRDASVRHAQAAISNGQDDALALTFAGFSIGMDAHDRAAAFTAFDAALAISPSSALTYILGSVVRGWAGEAERAIEWARHGLRLSPFDSWAFAAYHALVLGHFRSGRFGDAVDAAYKAVHANPGHSISHMLLAAALARCGKADDAKMAASTLSRLQPNFSPDRQFEGVDCEPALAAELGSALEAIGLPKRTVPDRDDLSRMPRRIPRRRERDQPI
jgi:TolB-like protein